MDRLLLENKDNMRIFNVKAEQVETLEKERSIVHYISTNDLDRGRDIVDPDGMDAKDFKKSPSVWYNHNYAYDASALPIAKSLWQKTNERGVLAKTQFAKTEFADDIYYLHKENFMKSWSIGWLPQLDNKGNIKDGALKYDEKSNKLFIYLWTLLEYSSAPIAMNPNALDEAKHYLGQLKTYKAKVEIEKAMNIAHLETKMDEIHSMLRSLTDQLAETKSVVDGNQEDIIHLTEALNKEINVITEEVKLEMGSKHVSSEWVQDAVANILRKGRRNH